MAPAETAGSNPERLLRNNRRRGILYPVVLLGMGGSRVPVIGRLMSISLRRFLAPCAPSPSGWYLISSDGRGAIRPKGAPPYRPDCSESPINGRLDLRYSRPRGSSLGARYPRASTSNVRAERGGRSASPVEKPVRSPRNRSRTSRTSRRLLLRSSRPLFRGRRR